MELSCGLFIIINVFLQTCSFHLNVKKCSIPCIYVEATAKLDGGRTYFRKYQKKPYEPYFFLVKETGEIVNLDFCWSYVPEYATIEDAILEVEPQIELVSEKSSRKAFLVK